MTLNPNLQMMALVGILLKITCDFVDKAALSRCDVKAIEGNGLSGRRQISFFYVILNGYL